MADQQPASIFAHIENPSAETKVIMEKLNVAYTTATSTDRTEVEKLVDLSRPSQRRSLAARHRLAPEEARSAEFRRAVMPRVRVGCAPCAAAAVALHAQFADARLRSARCSRAAL